MAQQDSARPITMAKNRLLVRRVIVSFGCSLVAALLTVPAGSAGHCGSANADCTIYPVNAVGVPTVDSIWIPFALVVGILAFAIIGWWRKFSNSPG